MARTADDHLRRAGGKLWEESLHVCTGVRFGGRGVRPHPVSVAEARIDDLSDAFR
jgi:hypothetical protein